MGLEEYGESNSTFLKIKHGCLCEESKKPRDGYKKVEGTLQDGTAYEKWIRPYKAVSGYVTKIEWYDREYNGRKFRGWNIHIDADGQPVVLDIAFDSRVNSRWMKVAENIDFRKTVRFSAWHDRKTDSTAFNVQQDGVSVPQRYTRENMGDCPEPVQRTSGKWDYGAQEDFLAQRMLDTVIPTVEAAAALRPLRTAQPVEEQTIAQQATQPDVDDKAERKVQGLESDDPFPEKLDMPDSEPDDSEIPF
jgi:hypothetical protein